MPDIAAKSVQSIPEFYTDGITIVGVVRRVFYHALYEIWDDATQTLRREWHYYGTTKAQKPPTTNDPVFEHSYVQIPNDFTYLPAEENDDALYKLGVACGEYREGLKVA